MGPSTGPSKEAHLRWPPSVRLKKRADFLRVSRTGRRFVGRHLLVLVAPGFSVGPRFGITVSRKVGNAVIRNRVKRRLREGLRRQIPQIKGDLDMVVIARSSAATASQPTLQSELESLLKTARTR